MVLFIDACARAESRTRKLAYSFLNELKENVREIRLYDMDIPLLDENAIIEREEAVRRRDDSNPFVAMATEFKNADMIVIAAPYWDMGYPAILRSYIEAIMVGEITFHFTEEGKSEGLCDAKKLYYITTAGGRVPKPNLGFSHIKSLATEMLGIPNVYYFAAEGLDIVENDADKIMEAKMAEIKALKETAEVYIFDTYKIMVVDDSKVNILRAEYILKENGYDVIAALSGADCLKLLKTHKVDMVLLDIKMPMMDGFETLDAIRENPDTAHLPVVFVTGDNTLDNVIEASKHEVSGYVTKPFSEEELMGHVKKILG